jgi:nucleotide sugar dehydrogenase
MNIGVVGVGRLGICFALLLERAGHQVLGSDIRANYVANLNRKQITTNEPQVADMLAASTNFTATTNTREVIKQNDIIYIMVATPSLADGSYDVSAVQRVVEDVKECDFDLTDKILVVGCTTNPGDCARIQQELENRGVKVLYNPEFIAQGSIIRDLQQADMVLIGGQDQATMDQYALLYNDIQTTTPKIHTMSLTAAEIVKIGINCFLTTKISYANTLGQVLIRSGLEADVRRALTAVGADTRVGSKYLQFGFGFGGPCLPRDNRSFGHYADKLGLKFNLGAIIDGFNREHADFLFEHFVQANTENLPFYMETISYKKNTDIFEESQQYRLCQDLLSAGHTVYVEPNDLTPAAISDDLIKRYPNQVKFVPLQQIQESVFQIGFK